MTQLWSVLSTRRTKCPNQSFNGTWPSAGPEKLDKKWVYPRTTANSTSSISTLKRRSCRHMKRNANWTPKICQLKMCQERRKMIHGLKWAKEGCPSRTWWERREEVRGAKMNKSLTKYQPTPQATWDGETRWFLRTRLKIRKWSRILAFNFFSNSHFSSASSL